MGNWQVYKQVITYIDQLHQDIGQLILLIEQLMAKESFHSISFEGNRASRGIGSHISKPDMWRIPYIYRLFLPDENELVEESLFYLIWLERDSPFEFPIMICGQFQHQSLTEKEIYDRVIYQSWVRSLAQRESRWRSFRDKEGWTVAEPSFDSPVQYFQGYILNLYDLSSRELVMKNVVQPLTRGRNTPLKDLLNLQPHPFPSQSERELL